MKNNNLKTLKDLSFQKMSINSREKQIIDIINENLKAEAVKWVKSGVFLNKINNEMLFYWMEFFNLTEEELTK